MRWLTAIAVCCVFAAAVLALATQPVAAMDLAKESPKERRLRKLMPAKLLKRRNQRPVIVPKGYAPHRLRCALLCCRVCV